MCFPLSPSSPSKFAFQQIPYLLPFEIHKVLCAAGRQGPAASGAEEIGSNEAKGGWWWATDGGRHLTQSCTLGSSSNTWSIRVHKEVYPHPFSNFYWAKTTIKKNMFDNTSITSHWHPLLLNSFCILHIRIFTFSPRGFIYMNFGLACFSPIRWAFRVLNTSSH